MALIDNDKGFIVSQTLKVMSFGGPIDSMQSSQRSNKGLLKGRKSLKEIQDSYPVNRKEIKPTVDDLAENKSRQDRVSYRDNERYLTFIKVLVTLLIATMLIWWLMSRDPSGVIDLIR
jgi:hypothetical protein